MYDTTNCRKVFQKRVDNGGNKYNLCRSQYNKKGNYIVTGSDDGTVAIWRYKDPSKALSDDCFDIQVLKKNESQVSMITFLPPDCETDLDDVVVFCTRKGGIHVYLEKDLLKDQKYHSFHAHSDFITDCQLMPKGDDILIVSCSEDGYLAVNSIKECATLQRIYFDGKLYQIVVDLSNSQVIATEYSRNLFFHKLKLMGSGKDVL